MRPHGLEWCSVWLHFVALSLQNSIKLYECVAARPTSWAHVLWKLWLCSVRHARFRLCRSTHEVESHEVRRVMGSVSHHTHPWSGVPCVGSPTATAGFYNCCFHPWSGAVLTRVPSVAQSTHEVEPRQVRGVMDDLFCHIHPWSGAPCTGTSQAPTGCAVATPKNVLHCGLIRGWTGTVSLPPDAIMLSMGPHGLEWCSMRHLVVQLYQNHIKLYATVYLLHGGVGWGGDIGMCEMCERWEMVFD